MQNLNYLPATSGWGSDWCGLGIQRESAVGFADVAVALAVQCGPGSPVHAALVPRWKQEN